MLATVGQDLGGAHAAEAEEHDVGLVLGALEDVLAPVVVEEDFFAGVVPAIRG